MSTTIPALAEALSDAADQLLSATEPLAGLQLACGGEIPGAIAVPALRELVVKARTFGLKLGRTIRASDGREQVLAWVEVEPLPHGGCAIRVNSWQANSLPPEDPPVISAHRTAIERTLAELTAQLDAQQCLRSVEATAPDLADLVAAMRAGNGQPWTNFAQVSGATHEQPMHWRLLDGASVTVAGSQRNWRASLLPHALPGGDPIGFELCLSADAPLPAPLEAVPDGALQPVNGPGLVGRDIAPVLRQPIARIIANAETIRTRMAGPLAEEYSQYAADIAAAGQHLLALVEDLADLEVVEAEQFNTAPDRIDLADVARRSAGILGVRAQERGITIDAPKLGEHLPAIAEFRRVLQVLLNLVGMRSAIRRTIRRSGSDWRTRAGGRG